jgi:hypothetical protein
MIECTSLFPEASWAAAHIHGPDIIRINVQHQNHIICIHMQISKISDFLDRVRMAEQAQKRESSGDASAGA